MNENFGFGEIIKDGNPFAHDADATEKAPYNGIPVAEVPIQPTIRHDRQYTFEREGIRSAGELSSEEVAAVIAATGIPELTPDHEEEPQEGTGGSDEGTKRIITFGGDERRIIKGYR